MTMVPAQTFPKHHRFRFSCESFGVMNRLDEDYNSCVSEVNCVLGSDLLLVCFNSMAEDESRTNSVSEPAAPTSKDNNNNDVIKAHYNINTTREDEDEERDDGWLQLRIGGHTTSRDQSQHQHQQIDPTASTRGGLIELDLLPGGSNKERPLSQQIFQVPLTTSSQVLSIPLTPSLSFQHQQGSSSSILHPQYQQTNWAFRHVPYNMATPPSSSSSQASSSSLMPFGSYFSRPFQGHNIGGIDIAGPSSSDFRVTDPPRRPHSGIWFTLQASQTQAQEPFLPQISKSYLRIKDGKMTVRLLMKYLVKKLSLDSESEVEITCRGQQLSPTLTLQHVRDSVWCPRDAVTLLPSVSSTVDHIMVLHYGRSTPRLQ